jgi:steroid delta-isomerase-like uncharacterized protein
MSFDGIATSDRSTEIILAFYDAFNCGDWDGMLSLLADNVVHDLNQGPREVGKAAFAAYLQRVGTSYKEQLHDIVVMVAPDGHRAAAEYVAHGSYVADDVGMTPARGQRYVLPGGAFFSIRNSRIQRISNYFNEREWISQVC